MKFIVLAMSASLVLGACTEVDPIESDDATNKLINGTEISAPNDTIPPVGKFSHKVVLTENGDWGYQIFEGATILINQKIIPSIQGNAGFKTKEKAEKTALYIIHKLENDIFPPSISPKELDSLGVL